MRHDETWKLETEPRQDIQVSRLSQDRDMKNHESRQSRDNTRVWRLHHCNTRLLDAIQIAVCNTKSCAWHV